MLFMSLGMALYHNRKQGEKRYIQAEKSAWLTASLEEYPHSFKRQGWQSWGLMVVIILYLVVGMIIPLNQMVTLVLMLLFLLLYYASFYTVRREWFMDVEGLWSRQQMGPIPYENIQSYEWRSYGGKQVLRVHYKGKGIVTLISDYAVAPHQQDEVSGLLDAHIAGL